MCHVFVSFSSHEGLGKKNLRRMTMKVNLLNARGELKEYLILIIEPTLS